MEPIETSEADEGFQALTELAHKTAGLVLSPKKSTMIKSRLRHRLKALSINSLTEYCDFVVSHAESDELSFMISALTTNVSDFFRESHHFDYISKNMINHLRSKLENGGRVRIWSAGCSNGQEPYSIAILLKEASDIFLYADCKILATDIDQSVLEFAINGKYEQNQISGLSSERLTSNFERNTHNYIVNDDIKKMISFRRLNLIDEWPMKGKFDIIFCRNVVIYFDSTTQSQLWPRFRKVLASDGVMFVGHSERISDQGFTPCGATSYRLHTDDLRSQN